MSAITPNVDVVRLVVVDLIVLVDAFVDGILCIRLRSSPFEACASS